MFYAYVVRSDRDGTTYIGSTEDLKKRVRDHNYGKTKSIRHKLPVKLIYYEAYETKTQAIKKRVGIKKSFEKEKRTF